MSSPDEIGSSPQRFDAAGAGNNNMEIVSDPPSSAPASPGMVGSSPLDMASSPFDENAARSGLANGGNGIELGSSPGLAFESSSPPPAFPSSILSETEILHRHHQMRRGDVQSDGRPALSEPMSFGSSTATDRTDTDGPTRFIWGTNVSIQESHDNFRQFLRDFTLRDRLVYDQQPLVPGESDKPLYIEMIKEMRILGTRVLNLDAKNLLAYAPTRKLYYQLIDFPQEVIPIMDNAAKECLYRIMQEQGSDAEADAFLLNKEVVKVRPYGLESHVGLRELNPGDIDKLVCIRGLVLRANQLIPDMNQAYFKCAVCNHHAEVFIDRGTIIEPTKCTSPSCAQNNSMQIQHNRCRFSDKQVIRLQETPDVIPDGQTPHSVSIVAYDELVDYAKAGDRVQVTGVFRSVPVRSNPVQRALKNLYKTYVDVVHIQKIDTRRLGPDATTVNSNETSLEAQVSEAQVGRQENLPELRAITEMEERKIRETSQRTDLYDLLARSIAPSIYEHEDVKKGILLQLFGGSNKVIEKSGSPRYRGDINVLLCGDPSTSKSQMLQYIHKIAPRGMYTSGKGSSAVGLTAYVTRDSETKQTVLESGALVLSDGGICCIDEFDKMSDSTRSVLHEVMEQQTVSIAKAGIITTLNARTSILASANPINSRYNPRLSVPQNIDLPPTLLSRFDLVYLMIDKIDYDSDKRLADHLTSMYLEDRPANARSNGEVLPLEFLTSYITYAKEHFNPRITSEAKTRIVTEYVAMRKLGEDIRSTQKRITATTRQLESIIRLSEARAKMRLSNDVLESDVIEAVRLIRGAIKDYATDPITGLIDMDLVQTGLSSAQRQLISQNADKVAAILERAPGGLPERELFRRYQDAQHGDAIDPTEFAAALTHMIEERRVEIMGAQGQRTIRLVDA